MSDQEQDSSLTLRRSDAEEEEEVDPDEVFEPGEGFDPTGRRLAEAVRQQFTKYIAFHRDVYEAEADTLTLWIMHTHGFEAFDATPYVLIQSPTEEAGKSLIFDVATPLARRAEVVVDPTPSSLFRLIESECPTLMIDEVDEIRSSKDLRSVLNAGYRYGGYVRRTETITGIGRVSVRFNVFCPKMFAGIADEQPPLKGATLSRCIQIPMQTRAPDEYVERFNRRRCERESAPLHKELAEWARNNQPALVERAERNITMPGLSDRQEEVWQPLVVIADHLGGNWPARARRASTELKKMEVRNPTTNRALILDLKRVWADFDADQMSSAELANKLGLLDDRLYPTPLTATGLSRKLNQVFRIQAQQVRPSGQQQVRGFKRSQFADVFNRYH